MTLSRHRRSQPVRQAAIRAVLSFSILAAALTAMPGTSRAEQAAAPPPEQAIAAWRVECSGDGKILDCRANQAVYQRETRQLVVSVGIKWGDGKTAPMTIQLPLGLNLTEPIQVRVDGNPPEKQPINTCANTGCFVVMTASDKLIAAMRTGKELKLTIQDASKKPIELALPLLGFGLAFDKTK